MDSVEARARLTTQTTQTKTRASVRLCACWNPRRPASCCSCRPAARCYLQRPTRRPWWSTTGSVIVVRHLILFCCGRNLTTLRWADKGAVANIKTSTWQRPELCPISHQGSALTSKSCPTCAGVILICEEEGSVFEDPHRLDLPSRLRADVDQCPSCNNAALVAFQHATWEQVQKIGFSPGQYV
jgi:hypothetical protein